MLRFTSFDIVFQEIPGEVTLAVNISNCPNRCRDCHSPHLWENIGHPLNTETVNELLEKYGDTITCFCFMGGDSDSQEINSIAHFIQNKWNHKLKVGWYSGKGKLAKEISLTNFNYIKLGPYISNLGGLESSQTNQRFYHIRDNRMIDTTFIFQKSS